MGRKKEADSIKAGAEAQTRAADTQENIANRFFGYADEDRGLQRALLDRISPVAEKFMSGEDPYSGLVRPARTDLTGTYRRNLADTMAGIQGDENASMAKVADYAASSGGARTGAPGLGLGMAFRGADAARTAARRGYQGELVKETQAQDADRQAAYEDAMQRRNTGLNLALSGANLLQGQQSMFDPTKAAAVGTGNLASSVGSRGAAAQGYQTSATMPGKYSWLGGLAAGALNVASNAVLPGGGLRNIWSRKPAMAAGTA